MRLKLIVTMAMVGTALALPSISDAAPPPTFLETAKASGDNLLLDDFSAFDIHVDAFSGPSGENPGGQVTFGFNPLFEVEPVTGPVTCLDVTGNTAVMTVAGPFSSFPGFLAFTVKVVDNGGSGLDRFQYFPIPPENSQFLDCRANPIPTDFGGPLIGRAQVFDSPSPPTTKDQCQGDGWKQFGFKNKGQCITFVKHGPRPPHANRTARSHPAGRGRLRSRIRHAAAALRSRRRN